MAALANPYPTAGTLAELRDNLDRVKARIASASHRAGRSDVVRLIPVSKTVDEARMRLAHAAGCGEFGENKVQEAQRKAQAMADLPGLRWVMVGHLQSNKAKSLAQFASEFQALDKLRVAALLDRHLQAAGRSMDVLVQVNTSNEASKYGLPPHEVAQFLRQLPVFSSLRVRGLMTLALFSPDPGRVRPCFVRLRELRERLRQDVPDGVDLDELSMGMSGDYELAVEEGATTVRVGQAIFGARALPDSHYWPATSA